MAPAVRGPHVEADFRDRTGLMAEPAGFVSGAGSGCEAWTTIETELPRGRPGTVSGNPLLNSSGAEGGNRTPRKRICSPSH